MLTIGNNEERLLVDVPESSAMAELLREIEQKDSVFLHAAEWLCSNAKVAAGSKVTPLMVAVALEQVAKREILGVRKQVQELATLKDTCSYEYWSLQERIARDVFFAQKMFRHAAVICAFESSRLLIDSGVLAERGEPRREENGPNFHIWVDHRITDGLKRFVET